MLIYVGTCCSPMPVYVYNYSSAVAASWTYLSSTPGDRFLSQSASFGGQFYIFGGSHLNLGIWGSVLSYNSSEDQWNDVGSLNVPRRYHGVTVVPQKLIANYCLGQPMESYSLTTFKPNTTDAPILSHLSQYLTLEAIISLSFNLVPSLCLSLMGLFMTILGLFELSQTEKNEISLRQKFSSSTLLAVIPIFIYDLMVALCTLCKSNLDPLKLVWFFGDQTTQEKNIHMNIVKVFYGQAPQFFFNFYIMMKTPLRSVQISQFISLIFSILTIARTSTNMIVFKQVAEQEPLKGIKAKANAFFKSLVSALKAVTFHLPLFLPNSLFNVATMVLFLRFCENIGKTWITFIYLLPLIVFYLMILSTNEIPFLTR